MQNIPNIPNIQDTTTTVVWWDQFITVCMILSAAVLVVTILLELLSIIFMLTPSDKDDQWLGKAKKIWLKWKPFLEAFHIKTPLTLLLNKVLERIRTLKEAIEEQKRELEKNKKK